MDPDHIIYNYEWFKTQYEKIGASEKQIGNTFESIEDFKLMYGDPKDWDYIDKDEYARLKTVLLGQKNFYEGLVADYNARSNMDQMPQSGNINCAVKVPNRAVKGKPIRSNLAGNPDKIKSCS